MTAISFSLSTRELRSKSSTRLVEKAKQLKTVQYTISSCLEFKIDERRDELDDLKQLQERQDVILSMTVTDTSFSSQRIHDLIKHFTSFIELSKVTRIDFDFSLYTGKPIKVLKKIVLLIQSIQGYFSYSLFISVTLRIGIFYGIHEYELCFLSYMLKELIHISMIQFSVPSEDKKRSVSWYEHLKSIKTKVSSQFDEKFSSYFKHARKPLFGFRIHYTFTKTLSVRLLPSDKLGKVDVDLQSCLKLCQEESIASLSFDIPKSSAEKLESLISYTYMKTVIPHLETRLLAPEEVLDLSSELLADISVADLLPSYEECPPTYSSSEEISDDSSTACALAH